MSLISSNKKNNFLALYNKCKSSDSNLLSVIASALYYKVLYKKLFLVHQRATIKKPENIEAGGILQLGIDSASKGY